MRQMCLTWLSDKKSWPEKKPIFINRRNSKNLKGFTLIEVIVSLALVTVVFVSLAQLFTISIMQNVRSNEISNAIFLAQQQIDFLRTLTSDELNNFPGEITGASDDEKIDINSDGTIDFRRLTRVQPLATMANAGFDVLIMVFPPAYQDTTAESLVANPENYKVRAYIHTIITR
ncbi:MAG: prepilin-type N-terminal cleavage/methylation domain-containing protein [Acidobacteriota bacterium]|nr:prepilin-type N-terminal cleavage/methylation domain-containing protein [Acidobacteriota bacterium]